MSDSARLSLSRLISPLLQEDSLASLNLGKYPLCAPMTLFLTSVIEIILL